MLHGYERDRDFQLIDVDTYALEVHGERERPDVLVSDLQMPGRRGCGLLRQVRALPPERGGATPAAALTGVIGPRAPGQHLARRVPVPPREAGRATPTRGVVAILALKAESSPS